MSALFLGVAVVATSVGWWDNGHMLIGEIARRNMDAKTVDRLNAVIATWNKDFPQHEDMVSATTWPDFIKCSQKASYCPGPLTALSQMNAWHFSDIPYNPDHLNLTAEVMTSWRQQPSAAWLLGSSIATFANSKTDWGWSFMLRLVLHILGDLHQPLHCAEGYFDDKIFGKLLNGDMGGNLIKVKSSDPSITNLHALWDAAGGLYEENCPLDNAGKERLTKNATMIIKKHPKASLKDYNHQETVECAKNLDCRFVFEKWANQSQLNAIEHAYKGASQDFTPSKEYLDNVMEISQQRIALGGYRLADLLTQFADNIPDAPAPSSQSNMSDASYYVAGFLGFVIVLIILYFTFFPRTSSTKNYSLVTNSEDV